MALGKALGTAAVWGGVVVLCYVFGSLGILTGVGAGWMVFAGFLMTIGIWKLQV